MRVAFQGEIGAFSEEAVLALFEEAELAPCATFEDVFEALTEERVERAVLPIENSLHGSVHANYDLLRDYDVQIVGECELRIRHYLLAAHGVALEDIERVYSHPQALGQCRSFLRAELSQAEAVPAHDTAGAARQIAEQDDRQAAAIASRRAADEYGLAVLASQIESNSQNYTRFWALARAEEQNAALIGDAPAKTSLMFALKENVPGALFKSLAVFALRELDLHKIESRPLIGRPGRYVFYLDVEGARHDEPVSRALGHLRELTRFVKVLGSYPQGHVVE